MRMQLDFGQAAPLNFSVPETRLWSAVIGRALEDALDNVATIPNGDRRNQICEEARNWFRRNGEDFRNTCSAAGYDPEALRGRVMRMLDARPPAHLQAHRTPQQG